MSHLTPRRFLVVNAVLVALLLVSIVGAALTGSVHVDLGRALFGGGADNVDRVILFDTRLPRVLLAAVVAGRWRRPARRCRGSSGTRSPSRT